jgi:DNA-binding CsgD family transcriptional regulator
MTLPSGPLRGRSELVARALSAVRGTRQYGSSALLLISGPPGIGKTALLSEICRQAAAMKLRIARSKCDEIEQVRPGAPVIAMLRAGREPVASALEYEQIVGTVDEPLLLADRIASHLEDIAAGTPVVIAIDDLQWADRVSSFLLRSLVSRLIGLPVVWLLASRDDAVGADLTGHEVIRVEHLRLAPLKPPDLAAIARDRLGRAPDERTRRFLDAADGSPFLAHQIIDGLTRAAARGDPDGLAAEFTAAIAHRLAELTDPARGLVHMVAVAGRPLPMGEVTALMPSGGRAGDDTAVADAIESGLILVCDNALTFRHDLVREAVYATVAGTVARDLHRSFADYYLNVAGDPLIAAPHARAAAAPGDLAGALILVSAAEKLAAVSADDAGELAALAFRTVRPAHGDWLGLSRRCLSVLCRTQRASEAIAVADLILAHVDDGNVIGQVETEAARALWLSGRVAELASRVERVLPAADLDPGVTARLGSAHALARTRMVPGGVAAKEAEAAVEQARAVGDEEALSLALQAAGEAAKSEGHHRLALQHFRELRAVTGTSHLAEEITQLQFLDRYDHAQTLLDQARADSANAIDTLLPALHCAQLWQDFNLGRLDDAEAGARALLELGRQLGNSVQILDAITIQTAVALLRGDTELAAQQLRVADQLTNADDGVRKPGLAVMRGWLQASRFDLQSALDTLRPVLRGAEASHSYWPLWPCWNGLFFEIGTAAADDAFATTCLVIAETAAARNPGVASFEGLALTLRGLRHRDVDTLADAVDTLARSPRPILRAMGAESFGHALLDAGRRSEGLAHLDRAWDEYHQMGARAFRAGVQRTMHKAGARRVKWSAANAAPTTGWASLTEAERRVAALISDGYTNKSAASALGVSVNTVGTHLRAIFAKLDVRSRVQLANVVRHEVVS